MPIALAKKMLVFLVLLRTQNVDKLITLKQTRRNGERSAKTTRHHKFCKGVS